VDTPQGPRWVTPDGILGPLGVDASGEDLVYVSSGATLPEFVHYKEPSDPRVEAVAAAQLLPTLLELNAPEVMLPILGWFFAAPLKPRIREALGHFPILFVWGLPGSCDRSGVSHQGQDAGVCFNGGTGSRLSTICASPILCHRLGPTVRRYRR